MQRFMVGTGRCGSTLLSRMLAECPEVTSLFEYFNGLDMARRFAEAPIDAAEFAELIAAEQPFVTAVVKRGYRVDEITYPFADDPEPEDGRPRGRYRAGERLPWLLVSMLSRLSDRPDDLFEELIAFAASGERASAPAHHLRLFEWLAQRSGAPAWIERSGSSIDYAPDMIAAFDEARIVHIHRSGPEVALSMREHHAYRLPISLLYDVPLGDEARVSTLPPLDFDSAPRPEDTISRILAARPPAEYFGRYWSDQVARGKPALDRLAERGRVLEVAFEDLVRDPPPFLTRIADFFALGQPGPARDAWIQRAAALVRGIPPTRIETLPADERERLHEACEKGNALIVR